MKFSLDFSLLPTVDRALVFTGLDRKVDQQLVAINFLPETLNRARGAVMLFDNARNARGEKEEWRNEAYIRGGLSDFTSMEDALTRDLKMAQVSKAGPRTRDSKHPLLHLMALLRNVNIHATSFTTSKHSTNILYPVDDPKEYAIEVAIISNLTVDQLLKKREERKHYVRQDLEDIVEWFNREQKAFGAPHLLARGVEIYCNELVACFGSLSNV